MTAASGQLQRALRRNATPKELPLSRPGAQLAAALLLIGVVYFALPNRSFEFDSITYARDVEERLLIHPHHLLHSLVGWLAWGAVNAVTPVRSIYVLQGLNSLGALAGLAFFYALARRYTGSHHLSLCGTLVTSKRGNWNCTSHLLSCLTALNPCVRQLLSGRRPPTITDTTRRELAACQRPLQPSS